MAEVFASADDVADRWRPLTPEEAARASVLIQDASLRVLRRFPTVLKRLESGDLDPLEVTAVVAGMVKRAMTTTEGVTQRSEGTGPFSGSETYANPMGNLYFTADDLATLTPAGQARRAFVVDLTPGL